MTANEMQHLYRMISEETITRYRMYYIVYGAIIVVLLALSIVKHVYPSIVWLGLLSLSFPDILFVLMLLYGLYKIQQASRQHQCLTNEKYMWTHVILASLYAVSEVFRASSDQLAKTRPSDPDFDRLFTRYYTSFLFCQVVWSVDLSFIAFLLCKLSLPTESREEFSKTGLVMFNSRQALQVVLDSSI